MRAHALLLLSLVPACGGEFTNDLFDEDARFLDAVPRTTELSLSAPAAEEDGTGTAQSALGPERATLYLITRRVTLDLDAHVVHRLRDVARLVAGPPTVREPARREWGPLSHPLDPLEARFVMEETARGEFDYALDKRAKGAADWTATITGSFDAVGGARQGRGSLAVDLDAEAGLTAAPARGLATLDYELGDGEAHIGLRLERFAREPGEPRVDATYDYHRHPAGGELGFAYEEAGGEQVEARSRWQADGAGRADGIWHARVDVAFSECWDAAFLRTFYDATPGGRPPEGDEGDCVFAERRLP